MRPPAVLQPTDDAAIVSGPGTTRLARDSVINLIGLGVPLVAALFAIPFLVHGLGTDRFGVLTLAWLIIGYFSLFDLGLGRALTQVVARDLAETRTAQAPALAWSALLLMFGLGLAGAVVVAAVAPWLVVAVFRIPIELRRETIDAWYILAAAIPVVVVTTGLAGILTAFQRFRALNALRAPLGVFTFVGPLCVLPFTSSLVAVTMVLAVGRVVAALAYYALCVRLLPPLDVRSALRLANIQPLFRIGAWMTVSNVVSPLMVYLDRFFIGALVSVAAVAYYATPYEMVSKLLIVPAAVIGVLFPAFASSFGRDSDGLLRLLVRGSKYVTLALFPVLLGITTFASEALRWWLGAEFAVNSTVVLQVIALGVFVNAPAQVLFTLVQSVGRPDLTAKFHVVELPIYLVALTVATHTYGAVGAAVAWSARVALDAALLAWATQHLVPAARPFLARMARALMLGVVTLAIPLAVGAFSARAMIGGLLFLVFPSLVWHLVFSDDERGELTRWIRAIRGIA